MNIEIKTKKKKRLCFFCRSKKSLKKINKKLVCEECRKDINLLQKEHQLTREDTERQYKALWVLGKKTRIKKPKKQKNSVFNYKQYLKSNHWKNKREEFYNSKYYDGCCSVCGLDENLQVHHKSYKNINNERLVDLVCVCGGCHIAVHDIVKYIKQNKIKGSDITLNNCHIKLRNKYIDVFGVEDAKNKILKELEITLDN